MTRLLTAHKVAAVLGVSTEKILRYCCVGKLPGFQGDASRRSSRRRGSLLRQLLREMKEAEQEAARRAEAKQLNAIPVLPDDDELKDKQR